MGTWLNLNGIWIELPLLIPRLSEGWALSPQLGMASNLANVGPLIIAFIRLLIGQSSAYEVPSICVIFAVGIIGPAILSLTWHKQVHFYGQDRSIPLLVCGFFLALVNCTSSVTYLPFVNRFDSKWLNIYFAGESLSSLLPALLGLLQVRRRRQTNISHLSLSIRAWDTNLSVFSNRTRRRCHRSCSHRDSPLKFISVACRYRCSSPLWPSFFSGELNLASDNPLRPSP